MQERIQMAVPAKERPDMRELRETVQATLDGGDPVPMQYRVITLYARVHNALLQSRNLAARTPGRTQFFLANAACYERAMEGLERLDDALAGNDMPALRDSFAFLQAAESDINALVEKEQAAAQPV